MSKTAATPFQVASLINPPSFPNAIVWSDDNLIAVASGDIVTIMNPEYPQNPRGVITLTPGKPFPIGVIDKADLFAGCLLPTRLSRDRQPCVRSLSWSPVGFTPHNGCLLAVCSAEGHVKVYHQPYCEFQAEWIEVMDISDMLHGYFAKINYGEPEAPLSAVFDDSAGQIRTENITAADKIDLTSKNHKRKRDKDFNHPGEVDVTNADSLCDIHAMKVVTESVVFRSAVMQEGSSVEVFKMDGGQNVWVAGTLQRLEGPMALVHLHETGATGEPQWLRMDSVRDLPNQPNNPGVPAADSNYSVPEIRPFMDVGRLPQNILLAEHSEVGEILKSGQLVEAWSRDRWLEGVLVDFSNKAPLVKFIGDAEAVELNTSDVRLAPLWIAEEKSWKVTVVQLHVQDSPEVVVKGSSYRKVNNSSQKASAAKNGINFVKKTPNNDAKHLLTAHQYALRSSMLSSLVVAWSPQLQLSATDTQKACDYSCLLAVGTKSGSISIWKTQRPAYYSVEHSNDPINMNIIGIVHAHDTWVTALSWGFLASDSNPRVLLASGCCDGSVKIWRARVCDLKKLSGTDQTPFSLINEVTAGNNVLVSAISLCVPVQSPRMIQLAAGKGSGSFEVWACNTKTKKSNKVGSYDAHVQAVTGLAWAFDGRCLYSCSQDNSMHGWIYHKGALSQVSIPPNNLGTRSFSDHPSVSDSCYGVAISPGNLALAVARRFDAGQLDHMYQKRTQRAAVEFFWIGGQQVEFSSTQNLELDVEVCSGFSKEDLGYWGSMFLWSLKQYECQTKHLVVWDIVAAFSAFKPCAPRFIKHVVLRWLELLLNDDNLDPSIENILSEMSKHMLDISSRQLHLVNIFCRRVIPSIELMAGKVCAKPAKLAESYGEEQQWMDILSKSEKELRERLVGLSLSTVLGLISDQASKVEIGSWNPVGITQMVKWVIQNQDRVGRQLSLFTSEIEGLGARLQSVCDYNAEEEKCSLCSAIVPFESPDYASCSSSVEYSDQESTQQQHKLTRCTVSMKVCPLTTLWFCMCCKRRCSNLPPLQLFTMNNYPPDFLSFIKPVINNLLPIPLCPYCGISLQRPQPDFLLSVSPV
ncbi:uncharacterized protein [Spinacia oleracea]|uniref:Uncharacterized protein LOC110797378 n=1 Tax=Spinacia oleracea TaxID=3562 RepID=A0A9R0J1H9_SPIOL|nr:uncharacterized protein LOC110797378 [Spinacia oleracea]XP_021858190.1 uncharacterized protein LOC110797378 [Spinacia oleracea]